MNADTLLENFEILAEAPSGVAHLKQLILDLAITGKLVKSETTSISMERKIRQLWEQIPEKERESVRFRRSERMPFVLESTIPDHWSSAFVEALTKLQTGATPSRAKPEYFKGNVKWLVSGDIKYSNISDCVGRISEKALKETNCKMIPINSVLIALNGQGKTRATVSILRVEATCNQSLVSMTPRDPQILTCEFLYLFLRSKYKRIREITGADDRRGLNMNIVSSLQISVPPIAEQRQIVDRVDELLALCDELEQQQKLRDNLRTATRKSAIDAISTATTPAELEAAWNRINNNWDVIVDTPESIDAMRKLILDLYTTPRIDQGDFVLKLGQVVQVLNGDRSANYPSKEQRVESGIPFINAGHLQNGDIDMSEMDFITPEKFQSLKGGMVQDGDILFCLRGSLGKCAIVRDIKEGTVASSLAILRPNEQVNSRYLLRFLQSGSCSRQIKKFDNGSAQPNLAAKSILNFELFLPALSAQNQVVKKIDELMALCDQLEARLKVRSEVAEKFARSVVSAA